MPIHLTVEQLTDNRYIMNNLREVADRFFTGSAKSRAIQDIFIKSMYLSNLFKISNESKINLDNCRILDVGCSKCDVLLTLKKFGLDKLTGINLFPYDMNWLNKSEDFDANFGSESNKINYITCDAEVESFPFNDSSYQIVLLLDVLEHLTDPQPVLNECVRVLSADGLLLIGTPNAANLRNRVYSTLGRSNYAFVDSYYDDSFRMEYKGFRRFTGHIREYTMAELNHIMKVFGLKILLESYYPSSVNLDSFKYRLYNLVERIYPPFSYNMSVIGQK